jgi:hypothetical protein
VNQVGRLWEKYAPYIAGLMAVLLFGMTGAVLVQQHLDSQTLNEHTSTLNQDAGTLAAVKELRKEVTTFVRTDGPLIVGGQNQLLAKLTWIECAQTALGGNVPTVSCGPRP